ncbi:hypothetical protein NCCP2716_23420 [Sporosarcina sp. NCCP-2716]|nr:hypothetical protein NCCP2716_23420 [Sporosarcina sp. NCCP-2716]
MHLVVTGAAETEQVRQEQTILRIVLHRENMMDSRRWRRLAVAFAFLAFIMIPTERAVPFL